MLVGGLGFFFFGMRTMSEGLKKIAGEKLKLFLHKVTQHPFIGVLVGAFVTCLIQSSSATTVMVVGFVNAGLLTLSQSISVVMGANIGTTFTAWLVSSMSIFKISSYALPCVGIGFAIMTLAKSKEKQSFGQVLLGFGLLFIGLHYMKDAFGPLKDSEVLKTTFVTFSDNPILGVLAGILFTVLLQSSSATIAIVQVLAFNGVIGFSAAIPIILGDNIGTTITAQMAAVGTNLNARRTAMSHTLFNVLGTVWILLFVYLGWFERFVDFIVPGEITLKNIMFHIAIAHSSFNIVNTLIFIPLIGLLEKTSIYLVPKKADSVDFGTQYLERHLLETPPLALEQTENEIIYMLNIARKAVNHAIDSYQNNDLSKIAKVTELEEVTDNLQSEITQYIIDLSQRELSTDASRKLPVFIHNVNDIERVGDHSRDLVELIKRKIDNKLPFSDTANSELQNLFREIQQMTDDTIMALKNTDQHIAQNIIDREERINRLQDQFKQNHINRLHKGTCNLRSGFLFLEIIDNLEKIGDRWTNIAQSVLGEMKWELKIVTKGELSKTP